MKAMELNNYVKSSSGLGDDRHYWRRLFMGHTVRNSPGMVYGCIHLDMILVFDIIKFDDFTF